MLFEHNINVFNELEQTLENETCCCVVMGTGVGKTYVASEYLDKYKCRALIVSPRRSINNAWYSHRNDIDTITYQKLANIYQTIDFSKYDVVICDEVHHIGAPTWGKPIKYLIDNKIVKVIGLTESSVRYTDGGKDVAEDYFYGNVAYGESVPSAIEKKILNPVTYVGAMYNSDGLKKTLNGKIQSRLYAKLNLTLNQTPTISEIIKKHMPDGKRKGIIFASTIEDINSAIEFIKSIYPSVEIKFVHSKQPESYNNQAFEWFRNTDEGYICSVDMISEGVHIKGVNTLIMLRRTESVNLFNQQLGRCLDAKSKEPAVLFDLVNNKYSIRIINNKLRIKTNSIFDSKRLNIVASEQLIVNDYTKDIVDVLKEIKLSIEGRWTEEEDNILKDFYKDHPGGKGLKEFGKKYLSHKTYSSIKCRAGYLGLTTPNAVPFTEEENNIIRKYYPIEGVKCLSRLNNHTKSSLQSQVVRLGCFFEGANLWTKEEVEIMKKYYPIEGSKIQYRLPNKSIRGILSKARKLGLTTGYLITWTKEEDEILFKNYKKMTTKELSKMVNHRVDAIVKRANTLGLHKQKCRILCVEENKIFENCKEAADFLNNPKAVSSIYCCLTGYKKSAYGYHWKYVEEE